MNFREHAAKEASELAARLTEAAATAADHAAKHAAGEAQKITDALREEYDAAIVEKTAIASQLNDARATVELLQAHLNDAHARAGHLQKELTGTQDHAGRLQADLNEAHTRGERQQAELTDAYAEAGRLQAQVNDAQQRTGEVQAELDAIRGHADNLHAELTNAQGQAGHLQVELQNAQGYADHLHGELKNAQARIEEFQAQLASAAERFESTRREADQAREAVERLEAARVELTAACDQQIAARNVAETELHSARSTADTLRAELSNAMNTLEQAAAERLASEDAAAAAGTQAQAAEAKMEAVTDLLKKSAARVKALEHAQQDHERTIRDLQSKAQTARSTPAPAAPVASAAAGILDDLMVGFQALTVATTISDVLTTLVEQMAAQFPRVALFRVKKGHLQGEHQIGFENYTDIGKLMLPLGMDSLPSRAASSGEIEILDGAALKDSRTPFNGTPAFAVAIPLAIGGEMLAVVYADDSGTRSVHGGGADDPRARYAEGMQRYAVALVMRLTNELKALAELQRYAASLLQEIEQMFDADVQAGKSDADLRKRLSGNLEYARSIYASRAAIEGDAAGALIEDELSALIEARAGTPFARHFAAAAGLGERNAAEAS